MPSKQILIRPKFGVHFKAIYFSRQYDLFPRSFCVIQRHNIKTIAILFDYCHFLTDSLLGLLS